MKRSREYLLWAFFLALCFWAGYLKGFLPLTFKHSVLVKGTIRIYNAAPFDFPRDAVASLEEDLGQRVEIIRLKNWDELQAKIVTKSGAHLLFAPVHWASTLHRENVIIGLSYIQPRLDKYISADFITLENKSSLSVPLYWTTTKFIVEAESFPGLELAQILKDKNLNQINLYPDQDIASIHLKKWQPQQKSFEGFSFRNPPTSLAPHTVWEVPSLVEIPKTRKLATDKEEALIAYGLMIPKNSINRRVSYRTVEALMENDFQNLVLSQMPLGTTLKDDDNQLKIDRSQRASQIRDLTLHELIILDQRRLKDVQDLRLHYNLSF